MTYLYRGNPANIYTQEFYPGVPARTLTNAEVAALPTDRQAAVQSEVLYILDTRNILTDANGEALTDAARGILWI